MVEVGKGTIHPDFDEHLLGHEPGESFSFELDYPENTQDPDLAGKRVRFDLTIKDLKEKEVPQLNDEFAQSLGTGQFETLEALSDEFRNRLQERDERRAFQNVRSQIVRKLLDQVQFEISPRVIEREAERMLNNLKRQFEVQGLHFDPEGLDSEHYKKISRLQAEKDIRTKLVLEKIAKAEAIELDSEDEEDVYRDIAASYRMDVKKFKNQYGDSALVESEKEKKLEDKVIKFIESEAVYVDTPEEAGVPETDTEPEQAE